MGLIVAVVWCVWRRMLRLLGVWGRVGVDGCGCLVCGGEWGLTVVVAWCVEESGGVYYCGCWVCGGGWWGCLVCVEAGGGVGRCSCMVCKGGMLRDWVGWRQAVLLIHGE